MVIRMLKELSEDLSRIRKIKAEIKVTLSDIMKNLQGINNGIDEAKNQINDLEHKKEKKKKNIQSEHQEEKTRIKKIRIS